MVEILSIFCITLVAIVAIGSTSGNGRVANKAIDSLRSAMVGRVNRK